MGTLHRYARPGDPSARCIRSAESALRRLAPDLARLAISLLLCRLQVQDYGFEDCCSPRVPMSDPGELPGLHAASLCKQLQ